MRTKEKFKFLISIIIQEFKYLLNLQPQPPPLGTLEYLQLLNAAIQQQQQSTTHQQLNLVNTPPTTKTNSHNNIPPPIQIPHPLLRQVRQTSSEQVT